MVISVQPVKKQIERLTEQEIERMINSGGKSNVEEKVVNSKEEIKFTIRIPKTLVERMDKLRSRRAAKASRNHWILDVIEKSLDEAEKVLIND